MTGLIFQVRLNKDRVEYFPLFSLAVQSKKTLDS